MYQMALQLIILLMNMLSLAMTKCYLEQSISTEENKVMNVSLLSSKIHYLTSLGTCYACARYVFERYLILIRL